MLGCALTYREAAVRTEAVEDTFSDAENAIRQWMSVLLHEARESMQHPLEAAPDNPFLYPVDVDTDQPGVVTEKNEMEIYRVNPSLVPRHVYRITQSRRYETDAPTHEFPIVDVDESKARVVADKALKRTLVSAQKRAMTAERRASEVHERRVARASETPEQRKCRLDDARAVREQRRLSKAAKGDAPEEASGSSDSATSRGEMNSAAEPSPMSTEADASKRSMSGSKRPAVPLTEDALVCLDTAMKLKPPVRKRVKGETVRFYTHPLPHHRHLYALEACAPHPSIAPGLMRGEHCPALQVIHGPPGTGKTRELVRRLKEEVESTDRVLLCAPTNVGAANLYHRCLEEGLGGECALTLAPERVPLGTPVSSNDPKRRVVCSTVSSRAGPMLDGETFDVVMVDEAAQCMEAWVWGLLRESTHTLVLAGDVRQLPATGVSETGVSLGHERSLMERLDRLQYSNTTTLTTQNRMAPELLALPNTLFYAGMLTTGPAAPSHGHMSLVVTDGHEESCGTSWINRREAKVAATEARALLGEVDNVVIITPYAAQCRLMLAEATGLEVHTVDSFQGREADGVVLCCVRDGSGGLGFWSDDRRLTVALTRARRRLVVVVSRVDSWPDAASMTSLVTHVTAEGHRSEK